MSLKFSATTISYLLLLSLLLAILSPTVDFLVVGQPPASSNQFRTISRTATSNMTFSSYSGLIRKLYQINLLNPVKMGLDNIRNIDRALGQASLEFYPLIDNNT